MGCQLVRWYHGSSGRCDPLLLLLLLLLQGTKATVVKCLNFINCQNSLTELVESILFKLSSLPCFTNIGGDLPVRVTHWVRLLSLLSCSIFASLAAGSIDNDGSRRSDVTRLITSMSITVDLRPRTRTELWSRPESPSSLMCDCCI